MEESYQHRAEIRRICLKNDEIRWLVHHGESLLENQTMKMEPHSENFRFYENLWSFCWLSGLWIKYKSNENLLI